MFASEFNHKFLSSLIEELYGTNVVFMEKLNSIGIDKKEDAIKKWRQGNSVPKVTELPFIAEALGVYVGDFFTNHDKDAVMKNELKKNPSKYYPSNIIMVDKLDMRAGAGASGLLDVPNEGNLIAVDKMIINGLSPKHLKVIEVIGDSMYPEFQEGDLALLDMVNGRHSFTKIGGIYIVRVNDMIYIKKVEFLPDGKLKLISINREYGDMIPHEQGYDYEILGKVCGKIHVAKGLTFDNQGIE